MMEKEKLRKADFFSGGLVLLVGIFILGQGLQMPMKDSWGGVQNVWYVSPALFPLFVGAMLCLLGLSLMKTAIREVRFTGVGEVFAYLGSSDFAHFLKNDSTTRFYGIILSLFIFVFLMVPRVDFFLAAAFFLLTLFFMYYCSGHTRLVKYMKLLLGWGALLCVLVFSGLPDRFSAIVSHPLDWLTSVAILLLITLTAKGSRTDSESTRKFRISLIIGLAAPLVVGIIFKFFLLVPLPFEGMVVQLLDSIWYSELWS